MPIQVSRAITVPDEEIELHFLRASGAGGQNVQRVESAVQLRFDVRNSPSLPDRVKARLAPLAGRRMTGDGVLVLTAQQHRTQARNRADAVERLTALLRAAAAPPPPPRRPTAPTRGSQERRLASKRARTATKRGRAAPADE